LTNIANRYSTTVQKLRQLNNLQNDSIQIGQRLRVK
jgi:LysM repeat protein